MKKIISLDNTEISVEIDFMSFVINIKCFDLKSLMHYADARKVSSALEKGIYSHSIMELRNFTI